MVKAVHLDVLVKFGQDSLRRAIEVPSHTRPQAHLLRECAQRTGSPDGVRH